MFLVAYGCRWIQAFWCVCHDSCIHVSVSIWSVLCVEVRSHKRGHPLIWDLRRATRMMWHMNATWDQTWHLGWAYVWCLTQDLRGWWDLLPWLPGGWMTRGRALTCTCIGPLGSCRRSCPWVQLWFPTLTVLQPLSTLCSGNQSSRMALQFGKNGIRDNDPLCSKRSGESRLSSFFKGFKGPLEGLIHNIDC